MNPHHEWVDHLDDMSKIVADLRIVKPQLDKSIEMLENNNIGVNVRYYPMCMIAPEYRRCICNDLQVVFDPYEWDYGIQPKTFEAFYDWGVRTSNVNEKKNGKCERCFMLYQCGGVNKRFYECMKEDYLPFEIGGNPEDFTDFYYYRQHNEMTLK